MLIEWVLLIRAGWRIGDATLRLAPGAMMMLALRSALTGTAWPWIALLLALSFPLHIADLRRKPLRGR